MKSIAAINIALFITVVSANKISCSKDAATAGSSLQNARKSLKKAKRSCPLSMIPSKREKCLSNLSKVSDKMKEVNEQVIAMSDDCSGVSFVVALLCMIFVLFLCTRYVSHFHHCRKDTLHRALPMQPSQKSKYNQQQVK